MAQLPDSVTSALPSLANIAEELFRGKIDVEFDTDPEIDDSNYVIFNVSVKGDASRASSLRSEWYRKTSKILGDNCDGVRLLISIEQ